MISELRQSYNSWEIVSAEIEQNKHIRLNWKSIIGMSLNKAAAKFKAAGISADDAITLIEFEFKIIDYDTRRRLKIGIHSRYVEQGIVDNAARNI